LSSSSSTSLSKELEPFSFDDLESQVGSLDLESPIISLISPSSSSLSSSSAKKTTGWNVEEMFLVNERKYGYKSTFNQDMIEYTIPIHKENTEEFRRREREAERIAFEIESDTNYKRNIDRELSDGEDEEEAFSAVIRQHNQSTKNTSNKNSKSNNNTTTKRNYIMSSNIEINYNDFNNNKYFTNGSKSASSNSDSRRSSKSAKSKRGGK
jgi:hypothetical protein